MSDLAGDQDVIDTTVVDVTAAPGPTTASVDSDPLVGRLAVVTGGSGAIGGRIAAMLAGAGARVCLVGRDVAKLRQAVSDADEPSQMLYLRCDLGSNSDIEELTEFIERFDRPVGVVVHAAHVAVAAGVVDGPVADLDEQYLVNVRGPYLLSQRLASSLRQSAGRVVFLTSSTDRPAVGDTQRASCDAAVVELARGLRAELAPDGVRVTTVHLPNTGRDAADGAPDAAQIARVVMDAVSAPPEVELSEMVIRGAIR